MDIFEITGYRTGVAKDGVTFLEPSDSFQEIENGFIYRQVLQSRKGIAKFAPRLSGETRVMGIFEDILPDDSRELLAFDKNFLYKYNTGSGEFDQVPFAGSMSGYSGFNITNNEDYISGTSYYTKTGGRRFVFTGRGITANSNGSSIFFYDGTDVKDFTNATDNADYAAPTAGTLTRATHVLYFAERINFILPEISGTRYNQGIVFSGIRNSAGNGDKFNVPGSGFIQLSTSQVIKGATILGDWILLNLTDAPWTLEITRDPFNPYYPRKVRSVIGTDASFSNAQWNTNNVSIGKEGVLMTDGRQSERIDDRIPNFTKDDIDPKNFELIYGGFDRENAQFLFNYKSNESDGSTQDSILVRNYHETSWSTYKMRTSVFGYTEVGRDLTWNQIDETQNPSWARWDTTEETWNKIGLSDHVNKTLAGDDKGFIYEFNRDYDDYVTDISSITQASQAVLTVSDSAFETGDLVTVSNVEGMTEINNFNPEEENNFFTPYTVVSATPTSITLNVDSTNFGTYTQGGIISKIISFSAKLNEFNPYRSRGRKCYISMVEFLLDTTGGKLLVDVYVDGETTPFKSNVLVKPRDNRKSRNFVDMTINQEANFFTFVLKQQSPSVQVRLTSMRIHTREGGMTYA